MHEEPTFSEDELANETWKQIEKAEQGYEVSNLGRVRSWKKRGPKSPATKTPTLISLQTKSKAADPYKEVSLKTPDGRKANWQVQKLVAEAFGAPGSGRTVLHLDGNRFNNRASNLTWGKVRSRAAFEEIDPTKVNLRKKLCNACGRHKPFPAFYSDASKVYGVSSQCRLCTKITQAAYMQTHRAEARARSRSHYEKDKEKWIASTRAWRLSNAERVRETTRRRFRERIETDPEFLERRREQVNTRRAMRAAQSVESVSRRVVFASSRGRCCLCGGGLDPKKWDLEHLTPLIRGGAHGYANVGAAHPACNQSKNRMTFEEWIVSERFIRSLGRDYPCE